MIGFRYDSSYTQIRFYLDNENRLGERIIMSTEFTCSIKRIRFDENYHPADSTRLTTNFANLARG